MNRIILIGNGFDLAHGLKTRYADFIDWYWKQWNGRLKVSFAREEKDGLCTFKLKNSVWSAGWYYFLTSDLRLPLNINKNLDVLSIVKQEHDSCDVIINSPLFEKICNEVEKGWVDIEDIYYTLLKNSSNPRQLNDDLDLIKDKLIEYLNDIQEKQINSNIFNPTIQKQILAPISKEEIAIESTDRWEEMLKHRLTYDDHQWHTLIDSYYLNQEEQMSAINDIGHFKEDFKTEILSGNFNDDMNKNYPAYRLPDNIILLNFNYTDIADRYLPRSVLFSSNHIHGSLSNPDSVIFGYGDERDDEYNVLMKKNDNEYLRHIKSFRYLEAPNYREMLSFIESAPYQICIMGHSCGLSDRTLLATLFEHPNCVSIKPYYYKKEDGTDNYRELVQNIARNFTSPTLMRDRVVRKDRCEALGKVKEG